MARGKAAAVNFVIPADLFAALGATRESTHAELRQVAWFDLMLRQFRRSPRSYYPPTALRPAFTRHARFPACSNSPLSFATPDFREQQIPELILHLKLRLTSRRYRRTCGNARCTTLIGTRMRGRKRRRVPLPPSREHTESCPTPFFGRSTLKGSGRVEVGAERDTLLTPAL